MTEIKEEWVETDNPIASAHCRYCWWREGHACYNEKLLRAGGVNKIPRTVDGDDRNGMAITETLWEACPKTSRFMPASLRALAKEQG